MAFALAIGILMSTDISFSWTRCCVKSTIESKITNNKSNKVSIAEILIVFYLMKP
jgi:hypothetical protein